ncbi:MAG: serine/threonine-protein kinase [Pseudomonadota bacterium]
MDKKNNALTSGTQVDEFIIDKVLGGGGFSIVYNAHHCKTQLAVVIKEYMPQKLAKREADNRVVSLSVKELDSFNKGQKLFYQEANSLALLKHKNIVNVITFFPDNGTSYMVMDEVKGINLQNYIRKHKGNLSEKLLRIIFVNVLSALACIHQKKLLHLDIKPGNIHLRSGGIPLLLDFGAVRETKGSRLYDSRVVATAGFAPIEQITERGYLGPWTDIYAMGATIRSCIEAKAPPTCSAREKEDLMKPAIEAFNKNYSEEFLHLLDWTMEVDPEARPQNCQLLIETLENLPAITKAAVKPKKGLFSLLSKNIFGS